MNMDLFVDHANNWWNHTSRISIQWLAKHPLTTLLMVIFICMSLMPFIMMMALTPAALLLNSYGITSVSGGLQSTCVLLFRGCILASLIIVLTVISLIAIIILGFMHSYGFIQFKTPFYKIKPHL